MATGGENPKFIKVEKMKNNDISQAATILGRKGGKVKSLAKTEAARKNIRKRWEKRKKI